MLAVKPLSFTLNCPANVTLPLTTMFVGPPGAANPNCSVALLLINSPLVAVINPFKASVPLLIVVPPV